MHPQKAPMQRLPHAMPPHGSDLTGPRSDSGPFEIFGSAVGPIRSPKVPF